MPRSGARRAVLAWQIATASASRRPASGVALRQQHLHHHRHLPFSACPTPTTVFLIRLAEYSRRSGAQRQRRERDAAR